MFRRDVLLLVAAVLSLASGFGFLLLFHAGFFVSLFAFDIADDTFLGALTFETLDSAIQRFVFTYFDDGHSFSPAFRKPIDAITI